MKTLKRPTLTGAQKLVGEIQLARIRLARAGSKLELAQVQARAAKRRRKEAKQAARRAKKQAQHAKEEFAEARQRLDKAEARFAKTGEQRGPAARPPKKKLATKAIRPKSGKIKKTARPPQARTVSSAGPRAPHLKQKLSAAGKQPARVTRKLETSSRAVAPILENENLVPEGYVIEQLGESNSAGSNPMETQCS